VNAAPLRLGILGAARIAPAAVIKPARTQPRVTIRAIAARDPARARAFAAKWTIPASYDSYDALLADPAVDAVYNPLPNGLHGRWTLAALDAGKHVLCEKPFAANAEEAAVVAARARDSGLVVMEAFHWRYHPMAARTLQLLAEGTIGTPTAMRAAVCFPLARRNDIRWQLDLAGGATMDAGCYPTHILRTFAGREPSVVTARALERSPGVDRALTATLDFGSGLTAELVTSMWSHHLLEVAVGIAGTDGSLRLRNPLMPHLFGRISVRSGARRWSEPAARSHTYDHQLDAFTAAVLDGAPFPTGPDDAVANLTVIDALYRAAGLEPRRPTP